MNHTETLMQVRVQAIRYEAEGILSFELCPTAPDYELPAFTAGSHIDLHLPNGQIRSYSLLNAQGETHRYVIGVNKDPASRGGSRFMHDSVRPGDILTVGAPRNNFALDETAEHTVLIAGGIGITPLYGMIQRLEELGRSWQLHYATRARKHAAFLAPLHELASDRPGSLNLNFDQESGGRYLDLPGIIAAAPPGTHFYCCGPLPMLEAFEKTADQLPSERVHVEYFAAKDAADTSGGFIIELARSGEEIAVPAGQTILDVLIEAGHQPLYSCQEGICGTCEVKVLAGEPDHRDLVLSAKQQKENRSMMICCSGCKGERLVLDL